MLNFLKRNKTLDLQPERILAIGDVHGCAEMLERLLAIVKPTARDLIVYLGDYVDRGPESKEVLDFVIRQADEQPVVCLRGNHEIMMLRARWSGFDFGQWQAAGGWETLLSYGAQNDRGWKSLVPAEHWQFLKETEEWLETDTHILVHAGLDPVRPLEKQSELNLYWNHDVKFARHCSGKKAVIGHTRLTNGEPRLFEGGVCIDTAAATGGWLTCLEIQSGEYWQMNAEGGSRHDRLENWSELTTA